MLFVRAACKWQVFPENCQQYMKHQTLTSSVRVRTVACLGRPLSLCYLALPSTSTSIITKAGTIAILFSPRPPHTCHILSSTIKCTVANTHMLPADASADDLLQACLSSLLAEAACLAQQRHRLLHAVDPSAAQLCTSSCRQRRCAERCCSHILPCRPGRSCICLACPHRRTRSVL